MPMFVHRVILGSSLRSGAVSSDNFPEIQITDVISSNVSSELPEFIMKLKGMAFRINACLTYSNSSYWPNNNK